MNLRSEVLPDLGKEPADTFAKDQHPDVKFDYVIANPPFNISRGRRTIRR